ncbi:glycosyltransferase family 2 protein [Latilactobacillus curvatus]|uniref:glycosyltransferase family 2 protein n=1 Tax=Latilactobacillus curvatus TaxID=28038 RepID=UPI002D79F5B7|nr:glycosyltransferase family 2 protein [Latilactobacillus curvatus]WRS46836.1 glycosyltransferase family 2 protein [Latilactobacillus curvatus]
MNELVSIITPVFNAEKHLVDTMNSVLEQSYQNWEWYLVDDRSTDSSVSIINSYCKKDLRIHLIENKENSGAAFSRNAALASAKGTYVAYLDSDDIWDMDKLEKQLSFMQKKEADFSCTSYRVITENGSLLNKNIFMAKQVDYTGFLTNNLLQTVGIMVHVETVGKKLCTMPNLRRRQDAATWLQILKAGYTCYGLSEVLASYRRTNGSLSSNKVKAVQGIWYLYRNVEKLSLPFSVYCFIRYAILAIWKRVYIRRR